MPTSFSFVLFVVCLAVQQVHSITIVFDGYYSDPNHPGMERRVYTEDCGTKVKGTDDGETFWLLPAEVKEDTILIDFSPKGGPPDLEGKWDGTGIVFPDGNKWTKVTNEIYAGFYADPNHPGMERRIYNMESGSIMIKGTDDGDSWWVLTAQPKEEIVEIDFSPKGGPADLVGKWDGTGIAFPDGNKWTKLTNDVLAGWYSDPEHPKMPREILNEGDYFRVSGSDDMDTFWDLYGILEGVDINIDFSPKGGPSNLKGYWDGAGIVFPDGNKWTKIEKPCTQSEP